jgi:hypothetical protein
MQRDDGADWIFIGGITLAMLSLVGFAATAFYFLVIAPPS